MLPRPLLCVPLRWPPRSGNPAGLGVPAALRHPGPSDHRSKGTPQLPHTTVSFGAADEGLPPRQARPSPQGRGSAKAGAAVAAVAVMAAAAEVAAADPSVAPLPEPAVPPAEAGRPGGQAAHLAKESPGIWLCRQAP